MFNKLNLEIKLSIILNILPVEKIAYDLEQLCIGRSNFQVPNYNITYANLKKNGYPNFLAG